MKKLFGILLVFLLVVSVPVFSVQVGNDTVNFIDVVYDYPNTGESTWYYEVISGASPAISHVTYVVNLDCLEVFEAGTWDGVDKFNLNPGGGNPVIGNDNATGYYGVKFDGGFAENETRYYYFTVNDKYDPGLVTFVSKAAADFDTAQITGPNYDCTTQSPVNPPVAGDDNGLTNEDTPIVLNLAVNDSDLDGNLLVSSVTVTSEPANGTVVNNGDGTVTYTPAPDFYGTDSFAYSIYDSTNLSDSAVVTVDVASVNDAPAASNDNASTNEGQSVTVNVTANDSGGPSNENQVLTVTAVSDPANGSVVNSGNGNVTYTPDSGFSGIDSFTYTVVDSDGATASATVTVVVSATDANGDSYSTLEDTPLNVAAPGVLANDFDQDGDPLSVASFTQPSHGSVTVNADGSFTYVPDADYYGPDSFTYSVSDGKGGTGSAQVNITVLPVNDSPAAGDDTAVVDEDGSVVVDVLGNDSDPDGDALSVSAVSNPANGTVVINNDGTVTYNPDPDFYGSDSFDYTVSDGNGGFSTATVYVTVNPVNDPPEAFNDTAVTDEDVAVTFDVTGNDSDPEGDSLSVVSVSDPPNGSVVVNGDGTVTYTPDPDYYGEDTFTYTVSDGNGGTDTAVVTVVIGALNDPPVASDDSASTPEDTGVTIDVASNDSDVDGNLNTGSVAVVSGPAHGSVVTNGDGSVTYVPYLNYNGSDSFTYEISDTDGITDSAVVTVTITPVNDVPTAADDEYSTQEDVALNVPAAGVLVNDSDVDGDVLSVTSYTQPSNGSLTLNADGSFTYVPNADYYGSDSFTYTVSDGNGGTDTGAVSLTVIPVNDNPVANDNNYITNEDESVQITKYSLLSNDSDADGDTLTIEGYTQPANGSLTVNGYGDFLYTPDENYYGNDSFTYTISDGNGASDTAVVYINVLPVNDAPSAVDDNYVTQQDVQLSVAAPGVLVNDSDIEGDTLVVDTFDAVGSFGGTVELNADGSLVYTPAAGFAGYDTFTYTVSDGNGGYATAQVTVEVEAVNNRSISLQFTGIIDDLTSDGNTVGGQFKIQNESGGYDVQIVDIKVEAQYRLPKGGGWKRVETVEGTGTFTPSPLFKVVNSQVVNFSGVELASQIPANATLRVTVKVKIYGRFNGQGKSDGWFLVRKSRIVKY